MKKVLLISSTLILLLHACSPKDEQKRHPWASFKEGSWVDVHTYHKMQMGEQNEPSVWETDSRITIGKNENGKVAVRHTGTAMDLDEEAFLFIPAVEELSGTRALGQWPHDIFPMGPERQAGLKPEDKNPNPENVKTKEVERNVEISLEGKSYKTIHYLKKWDVTVNKDSVKSSIHYKMNAWIAEGIELPLKWTITTSDGSDDSETDMISLSEIIKLGQNELTCLVTMTKKNSKMGLMEKKRWSSTQMPGFMVKMETHLKGESFNMEVKEWVTDFSVIEK